MDRGPLFWCQLACRGRLSRQDHAASPTYAVLAILSDCYPPPEGRLSTCYSPVRHFTRGRSPFLVRLACVRPAANVRSEPGSNSPVSLLPERTSPEGDILGKTYLAKTHYLRCSVFRDRRQLPRAGWVAYFKKPFPSRTRLYTRLGARCQHLFFRRFDSDRCRTEYRYYAGNLRRQGRRFQPGRAICHCNHVPLHARPVPGDPSLIPLAPRVTIPPAPPPHP